jgi:hypothetical protein
MSRKHFEQKKNRQRQQFQTLLSFERFDRFLIAIELTLVLKSNRLQLMQKIHDQLAFDHLEINKTIKLLKRNYTWSRMTRDIKQYIRNCHICKRAKASKERYQELLNSLSVSNRSWIDIILNFVVELSDSKEYNAIFMIVDRLSKMHHYILCTTDENEIFVEETAKLLIQHVWKLHELSTTMISNKESQFISLIWDIICKMSRIKTKLFIAFHSKTNNQSEIFNQKMKRYLRAYVNHQ